MKGVVLYVGHGQTQEWLNSATFFQSYPSNSLLRSFDILAYVNSTDVSAAQVEKYLSNFPNPGIRLFYTPCNGHSVDNTLPMICPSNKYKVDTNANRMGYWYGIIEAYANTFDLVRQYDYVVQLNPDVYITDPMPIEQYLRTQLSENVAHHVNTMRGDPENGFSTDFHIYRPALFQRNHFLDYKNAGYTTELLSKRASAPRFRFIPEQLLKKLIIGSELPYRIIGPSTRNDRMIDTFGLWHCHDNHAVAQFLKQ